MQSKLWSENIDIGIEPKSTGIGSDRSANCATTLAH